MNQTADIQYTVIAASTTYSNSLTPVSALASPNRFEPELVFPYSPIEISKDGIIWDFGDGTIYTSTTAEHVYNWPGTYNITLTILDEFGEPVTSTQVEQIEVLDFVSTQIQFNDLSDVVDIPSSRLVNPFKVNFTLSWQNYAQPPRNAPQCEDGKQHLMNRGKSTGKWMCGEYHPGSRNVSQLNVNDFPIYTFNLYASGAEAQPVNIDKYFENKDSHLITDWAFHSGTPTLSTTPVTSVDVSRFDFLTGSPGDPNTYDLLYYKRTGESDFTQTTPTDDGAVFVGVSGTADFYYRDDITKCKDSRSAPVLVTVELDETKLYDQITFNTQNNTSTKYRNNRPLAITNVKPRFNEAIQLGISTTGVNEFQINSNKWVDSEIHFTITIQDAFDFNILDSAIFSETDIKIGLIDSNSQPISSSNYCIKTISDTNDGYLKGSLLVSEPMENVQLTATVTHDQLSGYTTDAVVAWLNTYKPEDTLSGDEEFGRLYRYYYTENILFNSDQLTDNITTTLTGRAYDVETNGIISDVIVVFPGENLTSPPRITVDDPTGDGAQLVPRFEFDAGTISDVVVLKGGKNYTDTPTIYFTLSDANATVPNASAIVDYNKNLEHICVQPPVPGKLDPVIWSVDSLDPSRLVQITSRGELTKSASLSGIMTTPGTPRDMRLDNNGDIFLCTDNKVVKIDQIDQELSNIYDDNLGGLGAFVYIDDESNPIKMEVDTVNVYISNSKRITKINKISNDEGGTATLTDNVKEILLHYNNNIYVLTDNSTIEVVDIASMTVTEIINLPTGTYNGLTTSVNGNLYTVRDNQVIYGIDNELSTVQVLYDFSTNYPSSYITSICGDSRGIIWAPDDGERKLWSIDTEFSGDLQLNNSPDTLEFTKINYSPYPLPPDGKTDNHTLRAKGDWTGFHWLQKFGIIRPGTRQLVGYSSTFTVHPKTGTYNIAKFNEDHNHSKALKSYAIQPWLGDQNNLWDQAIDSIVGNDTSSPTSLGKLIYEKISNFLPNNNDLDDCGIDSIHNTALMYDLDMQQYNLNYPPTLKRLVDMCSIKHSRLFGSFDHVTETFDMYTDYTNQDTRENLGYEVDFYTYMLTPGDTIVAYEKFSKEYTPINVKTPLSGILDGNDNIIDSGTDKSLVSTETDSFPLSAYSVYWKWNLLAPLNVAGTDILNYYSFYTYNQSTEFNQVEGVIDWSNPQTLLTPTLSTYSNWSSDKGILDNIIEHQLRTGLGLFTAEYTHTTATSCTTAEIVYG